VWQTLIASAGSPTLAAIRTSRTAATVAVTVVLLLAAWTGLARGLAHGLPPGIMAQGLVYGALYSLSAVGVVLVYRASRVVNFAQAQLGLLGGTTAALLGAGHGLNFYLSVLAGLLVAALTGGLTHVLVIHRLRRSSRLLVAVATIGLAQALAGLVSFLPNLLCSAGGLGTCSLRGSFRFPLTASFNIYPVIFNGADLVSVIVAVGLLGLLAGLLRFTSWGRIMRGAAENRERAVLLGLRVFPVDVSVWVLAACLSAVAIFLHIGVFGYTGLASVPDSGDDLLLRVLAAAVIGGMESLPRTVAAALVLGLYDAGATWTSANVPLVDASLVLIIVVALLVQHRAFTRAGDAIGNWLTVGQSRPIPAVLANLPEIRWARRVGALVVAFALIDAPHLLPIDRVYLLAPLLVYGLVGLSLVLLSGWAGQISLGQFALAGLGGAVTAFLYQGHAWNFLAALAAGVAAAAAAAFAIGLPALRIRGPFLAVTTLAFALAMAEYVLPPQWFPFFVIQTMPRPTLWGRMTFASDAAMYYLVLGVFLVVLLALRSWRHSTPGRALIATRDNETAAEATGLPTARLRLVAFVLSGAVAGLAGGLFVMDQRGVFYGSFSADTSVLLFSMAVVGGLGSLSGVVFGVIYIWGVQYLLPPQWSIIVSGLGIVILLLFLPEGLAGLFELGRDGVLRRLARRRGIEVPELLASVVAEAAAPPPPGLSLAEELA
jgi:branched-chain amino acid transport system permease protein